MHRLHYLRDITHSFTLLIHSHDTFVSVTFPSVNQSYHTCKPSVNESCHACKVSHEWDMAHSFKYVTWLIHLHMWHDSFVYICDMTHSFTYVTWLIHLHMWHDSFMCICDMTHSFTYVTWLIRLHMWHDSFIYICDMTHSFTYVTWLIHRTFCRKLARVHTDVSLCLRGLASSRNGAAWVNTFYLSFFLSFLGFETHPNYWTKRMANTWLVIEDPRICPGLFLFYYQFPRS